MTETKLEQSDFVLRELGNTVRIVAEYLDDNDVGMVLQLPFEHAKRRLQEIFRNNYMSNLFVACASPPATISGYKSAFECRVCGEYSPRLSTRRACVGCDLEGCLEQNSCDSCLVKGVCKGKRVTICNGARLKLCFKCSPRKYFDCHFAVSKEHFGVCRGVRLYSVITKIPNGDATLLIACEGHYYNTTATNELFVQLLHDISTEPSRCLTYDIQMR